MSTSNAYARNTLELLRKCSLFESLGDADLRAIEPGCLWMKLKAGDTLFHMGAPGGSLYIISSGEIAIEGVRYYDEVEEVVHFATRRPGEIIGELSLFDQAPRSGSARAVSTAELLQVDSKYFLHYLERHPKVAINLLATIAKKLREAQEDQVKRETQSLSVRLAARLLQLVPEDKRREKNHTIHDGPTQKDLARELGCSREAISRTAGSWGPGLIVFSRGVIQIRRLDTVRKLAERGD